MNSIRKTFAFLLFAAAASTLAAPASPQKKTSPSGKATAGAKPEKPVRVTSVEGITEYRLANGLRVLLFPDQTKQTITVNITYLVGSRNENYGETGMAHLLEHLMFKGTPRHPNIPQELTSHGARPNGTTWLNRTNYYETFQATEENLKWALDLEADRMVHSFIAKKDLDSEMTVVRNEFEMGENSPASVLFERVVSTAFLWHNYGHPTIGARADIENVPIERLQAFWRTYYQPDNAYLLVAGKFDEEKTLALVNETFSKIPRPSRKLPTFYTAEPTQDGERSVTLRRVGDVQVVSAIYHVPAGAHPDLPALEILTEVLADTPSGRLHKALVETKKATSVDSFLPSLHDPGFVLFQAEVRQESSIDDTEKTMLQTIDAVVSNPATQEEVERARTRLLKEIDLTLNSADRVGLQMSEWIGAGDWRLFFLDRDRIKKVTVEDVRRVAAEYLKSSNRTVGLFLPTAKPDRAEIPSTPVVAALPLHFGDEKSLMGKSAVAVMAADMLPRGTQKHTRQQIKDEFDRLKARVHVSGGPTQATVSVETVRENLPQMLKLVAEVFREPSFPASELEQLRQENLAQIEQQKSDPDSIGQTAFNRHMNPYPKGDVRYTATPEESVADYTAATLEDVKKFYADYYGASVAELAVVGDFDAKEIGTLAGSLFGNWKSPRAFERVPRPYKAVEPANQSFETPDKPNAFFIAGLNLNIRDDDPDYPALVLGNYMLGGGFLNSRLALRIRQKEGLSYGVGSQLLASPLDKSGSFTAFAIYAPQNAGKLEAAFKEEIARALKDGFTEQELKEARSGYLQSRQVSRAQDAGLARTLAQDLFLKRTLEWDAAFEKKIAALTPGEILEAMHRHVDAAKITIVKAGDFTKAGAAPPPK